MFGPEGIKSHMIIKQRKSKRSCSDLPNDLEQDETHLWKLSSICFPSAEHNNMPFKGCALAKFKKISKIQ